jgi:hypothetical protein
MKAWVEKSQRTKREILEQMDEAIRKDRSIFETIRSKLFNVCKNIQLSIRNVEIVGFYQLFNGNLLKLGLQIDEILVSNNNESKFNSISNLALK